VADVGRAQFAAQCRVTLDQKPKATVIPCTVSKMTPTVASPATGIWRRARQPRKQRIKIGLSRVQSGRR